MARKSRLEELHDRLDILQANLSNEMKTSKPSKSYVEDLNFSIESVKSSISHLQRTGGLGYEFVNGFNS